MEKMDSIRMSYKNPFRRFRDCFFNAIDPPRSIPGLPAFHFTRGFPLFIASAMKGKRVAKSLRKSLYHT
jgi:hypothetical protein